MTIWTLCEACVAVTHQGARLVDTGAVPTDAWLCRALIDICGQ